MVSKRLIPHLVDDAELSDRHRMLIAKHLAPHLAQTFGYHALLYSSQAKSLSDGHLFIRHQVTIGKSGSDLSLICHYEELPIAADTIDLALLPGILQNTSNPHQVLREVERVLIPEGTVILIGRNPYSCRGIKRTIRQWRQNTSPKTPDISRSRIADWFRLLGFETESQINISIANERLQQSQLYPWLKRAGQYFCDYFCSYYIIVAKKKVSTLTPIRPSWRRNKHMVAPRLAEPSVRAQVEHWFKQFK